MSQEKFFKNYSRMILLQDVSEKDRTLLEWRCEVKITESDLNKEICYHREKMYLTRYVILHKYCCDLCNTHGDHFITNGKNICLIFFYLNIRDAF